MNVPDPGPGDRGQLALEWGHTPSHAEEDLIVGEGNALALAHINEYPNWPTPPWTLLQGPAKAGKSHLARIWAERAGAEVPEIGALEELSRAGGTSPLVLEDVDRAGYDEAALFHLLNQSMRDGRPLLLTAREAVANWPFETDDLKSRARLAAHFAVATSDDIQLSQMFVKLFGDRQVAVDPKIIAYLVARMERSPEEAVTLVGMMDGMAMARGTAITRTIAAEALALRDAARDKAQLALDLTPEDLEGQENLEGDDDE
jgi:chromosomal replication initiation ATPase DnaA